MFNPAKELIERLKTEETKKTENESDSDHEFQLEVIQPSGSQQDTEEPVTEIEHIQYEDDGAANNADTDSDDDSD